MLNSLFVCLFVAFVFPLPSCVLGHIACRSRWFMVLCVPQVLAVRVSPSGTTSTQQVQNTTAFHSIEPNSTQIQLTSSQSKLDEQVRVWICFISSGIVKNRWHPYRKQTKKKSSTNTLNIWVMLCVLRASAFIDPVSTWREAPFKHWNTVLWTSICWRDCRGWGWKLEPFDPTLTTLRCVAVCRGYSPGGQHAVPQPHLQHPDPHHAARRPQGRRDR